MAIWFGLLAAQLVANIATANDGRGELPLEGSSSPAEDGPSTSTAKLIERAS